MDRPFVIIAGPTASGKSALAIKLAKELNGEIVNLDSVQVYKEFEIGAAQPSEEEKKEVAHHLFGVLEPNEKISVGRYVKMFNATKFHLIQRGIVPFVVGGTSLYIQSVLSGLSDLPEDKNVRQSVEKFSNEQIVEQLRDRDPTALETIHSNDRVRLSRALEVALLGFKISDSHFQHRQQSPHPAIIIVPMLPRDSLYGRINFRTNKMIENGLINEVRSIIDRWGINESEIPALRSIGYQETVAFLKQNRNESDHAAISALIEEIAQATRRFAKRQMTWLRNEPIKQKWIMRPHKKDSAKVLDSMKNSVKRNQIVKDFNVWDVNYTTLIEELKKTLMGDPSEWASPVQVWFVPAEDLLYKPFNEY